MQRRTRPGSSPNRLKLVIFISIILFCIALLGGGNLMYQELRSISQNQEIILLKLTPSTTTPDPTEEADGDAEYVTKVEFIKFKNENKRIIRDLTRELKRVQSRLKITKSTLD